MNVTKHLIGDIIALENRIYRIGWSKWQNGKMQGNRAILKLIREKELSKIILEDNKAEEEKYKQLILKHNNGS